jgi:hypothetical protein
MESCENVYLGKAAGLEVLIILTWYGSEVRTLYRAPHKCLRKNYLVSHADRWWHMTGQHLCHLETSQRYATLLAILLEAKATLIDQGLDLHDRMIGALFNRGKRRHAEEFQQSGEAMHEKVRLYERIGEALLQARQSGMDPFPAIEAIIP